MDQQFVKDLRIETINPFEYYFIIVNSYWLGLSCSLVRLSHIYGDTFIRGGSISESRIQ